MKKRKRLTRRYSNYHRPKINDVCVFSPGLLLTENIVQPFTPFEKQDIDLGDLCQVIRIREHLIEVKFDGKEKTDLVSMEFLIPINLKTKEKIQTKENKNINQEEHQSEEIESESKKKLTKAEIEIADKRLRQTNWYQDNLHRFQQEENRQKKFDEEAEREGKARGKLRKFQPKMWVRDGKKVIPF